MAHSEAIAPPLHPLPPASSWWTCEPGEFYPVAHDQEYRMRLGGTSSAAYGAGRESRTPKAERRYHEEDDAA